MLIGRCDLDFNAENPFTTVDKLLKAQTDKPTFTLVEFHAGATSEKLAMAYYLDGRVSALWGTHTHVPTADMQVFPKGTGYVTDLGMTGPVRSGHPAGAVCGVLPGRSAGPLSGGGGPLLRSGVHFYPEQRHGNVRKSGQNRDEITGRYEKRTGKIFEKT